VYFTRDVATGVGEHVMIGSMRYGIRWSEALFMKALFMYSPHLTNRGILYDGSVERRLVYTPEGGDVYPLRPDTVMFGFSERSSPAAIDHFAELVFAHAGVENVIVVVMPRENTAIHLDMMFTQVDRQLCIVYPPHVIGPERLPVLLRRKGQAQLREMPRVFAALAECGLPMEPIFCGGTKRAMQEREQWASGCNFLALRPGAVASCARSEATLREMERTGFPIGSGDALLTGQHRIADDERAVITFQGSELVRGGGGPRCMTWPIERDDAWG